MSTDKSVPEWMLCQEILVNVKNELILETVDALHREMDSKRIEINAKMMIKDLEKPGEMERDLFIINNILTQEHEIRRKYGEVITDAEQGKIEDPAMLARIDELKKFILSVTEIHVLMRYARIVEQWVTDLAWVMEFEKPEQIIASTAKRNVERIEALEFVLSDKAFMKNEGLTEEDYKTIQEAYKLCK